MKIMRVLGNRIDANWMASMLYGISFFIANNYPSFLLSVVYQHWKVWLFEIKARPLSSFLLNYWLVYITTNKPNKKNGIESSMNEGHLSLQQTPRPSADCWYKGENLIKRRSILIYLIFNDNRIIHGMPTPSKTQRFRYKPYLRWFIKVDQRTQQDSSNIYYNSNTIL